MRGKITESVVIETALSVLKIQAQFAEKVKSLKAANAKSTTTNISSLRGESQNLQRLIEKANSTKLTLWEKQHAGCMSREAFLSESEKLSNQVTVYSDKIAELETQIRKLELESEQENTFVERFSKQAFITELSRKVVDEFIQAIYIYAADRVEIILNYADEYELIRAQMGT